jgi:hypothetical protein
MEFVMESWRTVTQIVASASKLGIKAGAGIKLAILVVVKVQ